jgi:hypothetical protein
VSLLQRLLGALGARPAGTTGTATEGFNRLGRCRYGPLLYVENDRAEKVASLINCIAAMGYRMYWHFPPYFNPENFHGRADNLFDKLASRNMLCVPDERALSVKGLDPVVVPD